MSVFIIHKDGVYNFYSTVTDSPQYATGLVLDEVVKIIQDEAGTIGINALRDRLERAHKKGCSSYDDMTLEELVWDNRAGIHADNMSFDDFVAKFLTLPKADGVGEVADKEVADKEVTDKEVSEGKVRGADKVKTAMSDNKIVAWLMTFAFISSLLTSLFIEPDWMATWFAFTSAYFSWRVVWEGKG
jgi:hypothetical protein